MPEHNPTQTPPQVSAVLAQTGPVGACQHLRLTGPFAWLELLGARHVVGVLDALRGELGEERYRVAPSLRRRLTNAG